MVNQPIPPRPRPDFPGRGNEPFDTAQELFQLKRNIDRLERNYENQLRNLASQIEVIREEHQKLANENSVIASKEALLGDLLTIQADLIRQYNALEELVNHTYQFHREMLYILHEIRGYSFHFYQVQWYNWIVIVASGLLIMTATLQMVIISR